MESHAVFFHLNLKMQFSVPVRLEYMYSCPYCFPKFPLTKDMPIFREEKKKKFFLGNCQTLFPYEEKQFWGAVARSGAGKGLITSLTKSLVLFPMWGRPEPYNGGVSMPLQSHSLFFIFTIWWHCTKTSAVYVTCFWKHRVWLGGP